MENERDRDDDDGFPLVEDADDVRELPTVEEWLGAGAPMREVDPE